MNPEILKQIIEAVNHLGGSAKEAYTYYLLAAYGAEFLEYVLGWAGGLGLAWIVCARLIPNIVPACSGGLDAFMREMRDLARIGVPGHLTDGERERTKSAIREAMIAKFEKKVTP